jgi:primary-amine oxidase
MAKPRDDLKPLYVVQPEGVSYTLRGNEISWSKWNFHIGFHPRDGLTINTVTYKDGDEVRPLFYRLSCAEMTVPYAETLFPAPRKFAFDVGEYSIGTLANSLAIGCDCLGSISYLDGTYVGLDGSPVTIKQCICIHEEDAGLAFKHTDYREGGRAYSARNRKLVVQMICTIANYEYIFNYNFFADGNIQVEVRLTGILNLALKREGEAEVNPYGVEVAPSVTAQLHQHIFSLRIDPMIDGHENTVVQSDVLPTAAPVGSPANYLGNGFRQSSSNITQAGGYDWDATKHRTFSIVNTKRRHYASGLPVSYRIHTRDYETLAPHRDAMVTKRARFSTKALWVSKHNEEQLWPAGKYVPQQRDTAKDDISHWVEDGHNVENEALVAWVTFGITHVPRPEE